MVLAVSLLAALATPMLQCALIEQASAHQTFDAAAAASHGTAHQHEHQHHESPASDSGSHAESCCSNGTVLAPFPGVRADELTCPGINTVFQGVDWSNTPASTARQFVAESLRFRTHSPPLGSEKLFLVNSLLLI